MRYPLVAGANASENRNCQSVKQVDVIAKAVNIKKFIVEGESAYLREGFYLIDLLKA